MLNNTSLPILSAGVVYYILGGTFTCDCSVTIKSSIWNIPTRFHPNWWKCSWMALKNILGLLQYLHIFKPFHTVLCVISALIAVSGYIYLTSLQCFDKARQVQRLRISLTCTHPPLRTSYPEQTGSTSLQHWFYQRWAPGEILMEETRRKAYCICT